VSTTFYHVGCWATEKTSPTTTTYTDPVSCWPFSDPSLQRQNSPPMLPRWEKEACSTRKQVSTSTGATIAVLRRRANDRRGSCLSCRFPRQAFYTAKQTPFPGHSPRMMSQQPQGRVRIPFSPHVRSPSPPPQPALPKPYLPFVTSLSTLAPAASFIQVSWRPTGGRESPESAARPLFVLVGLMP